MKNNSKFFILFLILVLLFLIFSITIIKKLNKDKNNEISNINKRKMINIKVIGFDEGKLIPKIYTCDGKDINPKIEINLKNWSEIKSLVLIVDDPDVPSGTWYHWIVANIKPENQIVIDENSKPKTGIQIKNSFGKYDYGGPCPPSGTHRYYFKIYGLNTELNVTKDTPINEILELIKKYGVESSSYMGIYKR